MEYGGCETWEQIVLQRIYEQRGIESPRITRTVSVVCLGKRSGLSKVAENDASQTYCEADPTVRNASHCSEATQRDSNLALI